MAKIEWDRKTGGVILKRHYTNDTLSVSPRPVFFEELDLLKLGELGWKYPRCQEPLMWACNKQYFYKGDFVFEVKGANIYDEPTVVFKSGFEKLSLKPVDVKAMLAKNADEMFLLESEAIEFIRDIYSMYTSAKETIKKAKANEIDFETLAAKAEKSTKQKMAIVKQDCESFDIMPLDVAEASGKKVYQTTRIDKFLASFSGGKDSQVVLDLCTRAIPPQNFEVIYSDTGYELPPSLKLYKEVEEYYHKRYPELKFSIAKNHASVLNYWDKIGTPSDTHRWCCAVMKTGPLYRMLKMEDNKQARVLTFDGVRAEESTRRSGYSRIGKGVKHDTVINARPILYWNSTEIFLYLFRYQLPVNIAYRQGMTRVGCLVCPFANEWNERIANVCYNKEVQPFLERIESYAKKAGIKDIKEYVEHGGWKRRASGNLFDRESSVDFKSVNGKFVSIIKNPSISPLSFLHTLGSYSESLEGNHIAGEIRINKDIYRYTVDLVGDTHTFEVKNLTDPIIIGLFKRVLYKGAYCINCETCEVECPTGALSVYPTVTINKNKCIHCHKCLEFHDKGCIAANSLSITTGLTMLNNVGNIDRYKNFGLKEEWLSAYLVELDGYWTSNHGLNVNYQIPSLKAWLKDAGFIDEKNSATELAKLMANKEVVENYPNLMWEIAWINLSYNSAIINWFTQQINTGINCNQKSLEELMKVQYPTYKDKTVHNAIYQLRRTLKESPIGAILLQGIDQNKEDFIRNSYDELSKEATVYSIYKFAELKNVLNLRVSDFYQDEMPTCVFKEFRITRKALEGILRSLNSEMNRVLVAELNMGLDNITLRDDLNSLMALKAILHIG